MDDPVVVMFLKNAWILICGVFGWMGRGMYADIKNLQKSDADCKLDLANFKAEVANDYAKQETTQSSLARIHDKMESGFDTLHKDIKTILTTMKR